MRGLERLFAFQDDISTVHTFESRFNPCQSGGGVGNQRGQKFTCGTREGLNLNLAPFCGRPKLLTPLRACGRVQRSWRNSKGCVVWSSSGPLRAESNEIQADNQTLLCSLRCSIELEHCAFAPADFNIRVVFVEVSLQNFGDRRK